MSDESVMKNNENSSSFNDQLTKEYNQAVAKGFKGTKEEYLRARDYT